MPTNSVCKKYQNTWTENFGLRVGSRDSKTVEIMSVRCLFCEFGGKEVDQRDEGKRKASERIKFFGPPWRSDNFSSHPSRNHPHRYKIYKALAHQEKQAYFKKYESKAQNLFNNPINITENGLTMLINKDIVEVIVGQLLLDKDSDDDELNDRKSALGIFHLQEIDILSADQDENSERYLLAYKNLLQFNLIVAYIKAGLSFRQCVLVAQSTKEQTHLGQIGNASQKKTITAIRYVCAINYQMLYHILNSIWEFSIAFDGGNKSDTSYLCVRIRFTMENKLYNYHVVAIPMRERHTGENMYSLIDKFFTILCPGWRNKLIGISTDDTSSMTGRISGFVSRIHRECLDSCYRVWCAAHQMDLVVQKIFKQLLQECFVQQVMAVTGYLRRQQNLVSDMKTKCPRFIDNKWILYNRNAVEEYFVRKNPACKPTTKWWIVISCLRSFIVPWNICLTSIQGLTTLVSEQRNKIDNLKNLLQDDGYVEGPQDQFEEVEEGAEPSLNGSIVVGKFRVIYENANKFLEDRGLVVGEMVETLKFEDYEEYIDVVKTVAFLYASGVDGLTNVVAERDANNLPTDSLPQVLPQELVKLRPYDFSKTIKMHQEHFKFTCTDEEIQEVPEGFLSFRDTYRREMGQKKIIDAFTNATTFEMAWRPFIDRFPVMCTFIGGLASVFPGTSTVESDFSVIGVEKDCYRQSLTDFSLEGVLQSKQFHSIRALSDQMN